MYSMYYFGIKGPNPLIFGRKERYIVSTTQSKLVLTIEQLEQIQYIVKAPTSGLKQLVLVLRSVFVQQAMTTSLHVNIFVATKLLGPMVMVFQFNNQ